MALKKECPLVKVFAGPSGHAKTELAKLMGYLLSMESVIIDCTKIAHEMYLFGSSTGYSNQAKGPLSTIFWHHRMKSQALYSSRNLKKQGASS